MSECNGHSSGPFDPMGMTVYCDGRCRPSPRWIWWARMQLIILTIQWDEWIHRPGVDDEDGNAAIERIVHEAIVWIDDGIEHYHADAPAAWLSAQIGDTTAALARVAITPIRLPLLLPGIRAVGR